jgi:hypothetical protein
MGNSLVGHLEIGIEQRPGKKIDSKKGRGIRCIWARKEGSSPGMSAGEENDHEGCVGWIRLEKGVSFMGHGAFRTNVLLMLVIGGIVVLILFTLWGGRSGQEGVAPLRLLGERERVPAPDFELRDLEGRSVRLSDHRGKTVLVSFVATW